jgi:hypothetical protein
MTTPAATSYNTGSVVYAVYLNGTTLFDSPQLIMDAELRQTFSSHDFFYLRIEYPPAVNVSTIQFWADNLPVKIIWGQQPDTNTWYGYVDHHRTTSSSDSGTNIFSVEYICIGSSYVLNNCLTQTWQNVSPSYIAMQIGQTLGFRQVLTNMSTVVNFEAQAGESSIGFLNRLGDKYGLRLWCSGGTLYFISPQVALNAGGQANTALTFTLNKDLKLQDTLRDFHLTGGQGLPGAIVANRAIYGVDPTTNQMFVGVSNPPTTTTQNYFNTERTATSYAQALQLADAWQSVSQHWNGAEATVWGRTMLYPGKVVSLQGTRMPAGTTGDWLVVSSHHVLKSSGLAYPPIDRYLCHIQVARNSPSALSVTNSSAVSPEFVTMTLSASTSTAVTSNANISTSTTSTTGTATAASAGGTQSQWKSSDLSTIYDGTIGASTTTGQTTGTPALAGVTG